MYSPTCEMLTSPFNIGATAGEGHHSNNDASDDDDDDELHDEGDGLSQMMDTLANIV